MSEHILVFGSFVVDLMSRAPHLPVPGETVKGSVFRMGPGGKGFNQGVAAKRAGADVTMATKVGGDLFADIALDTMRALEMDTRYVFRSDTAGTGTALILVDENTSENAILVVPGACGTITAQDLERVGPLLDRSRYLLTQLETNMDAVEAVIRSAYERGVRVILNPAPVQPVSDGLLSMVSILTPNEVEAEILSGIKVDSEENARRAAHYFIDKGVETVVITWGRRGAFVATAEESRLLPVPRVEVLDTTGAGDAFNGGLVTALSEGEDIWSACAFANALAAISVTRLGTTPSMPERGEIDRFLREHSVELGG